MWILHISPLNWDIKNFFYRDVILNSEPENGIVFLPLVFASLLDFENLAILLKGFKFFWNMQINMANQTPCLTDPK